MSEPAEKSYSASMDKVNCLKNLGEALNGMEPEGNTICEVLHSMAMDYSGGGVAMKKVSGTLSLAQDGSKYYQEVELSVTDEFDNYRPACIYVMLRPEVTGNPIVYQDGPSSELVLAVINDPLNFGHPKIGIAAANADLNGNDFEILLVPFGQLDDITLSEEQ